MVSRLVIRRSTRNSVLNPALSRQIDAIIIQLDDQPPSWRRAILRIRKALLERNVPAVSIDAPRRRAYVRAYAFEARRARAAQQQTSEVRHG